MTSERLQPVDRTTAFFEQNAEQLKQALQDRFVVLQGTNKAFQLTSLEAYTQVGPYYSRIKQFIPGEFWTPKKRSIKQSLIVARGELEPGACVRVLRARCYDAQTDSFTPTKGEGELATYLGLDENIQLRLKFIDDTDILYLAAS